MKGMKNIYLFNSHLVSMGQARPVTKDCYQIYGFTRTGQFFFTGWQLSKSQVQWLKERLSKIFTVRLTRKDWNYILAEAEYYIPVTNFSDEGKGIKKFISKNKKCVIYIKEVSIKEVGVEIFNKKTIGNSWNGTCIYIDKSSLDVFRKAFAKNK